MRLKFYDTVEDCSLELETGKYRERELLIKIYLKLLEQNTAEEVNELLSRIIEGDK